MHLRIWTASHGLRSHDKVATPAVFGCDWILNRQKIRSNDATIVSAQMVTRFAGTDSRVGASRATLSFLKNQIDAWNNSNR